MRVASIVISLAISFAAAAPANACRVAGPSISYYFETLPTDLAPNELILEVRPPSREAYKTPPFYALGERIIGSSSVTHRHSIVRVVHGAFEGDEILVPVSSFCGYVIADPPKLARTGYIVGFATPSSPDWHDAPALVVRFSPLPSEDLTVHQPANSGEAASGWMLQPPSQATLAQMSDPIMTLELARNARDPAIIKLYFDRAVALYRTRAEGGDESAMIALALALREGLSHDNRSLRDHPAEPDFDPAAEWLERAALRGNSRAMALLAQSYDQRARGKTFPHFGAAATDWYLNAANAGYTCAMQNLAQRYRFGWGAPVDMAQARLWFRKAVAAGVIMSSDGYEFDDEPPQGAPHLTQIDCRRQPQ